MYDALELHATQAWHNHFEVVGLEVGGGSVIKKSVVLVQLVGHNQPAPKRRAKGRTAKGSGNTL